MLCSIFCPKYCIILPSPPASEKCHFIHRRKENRIITVEEIDEVLSIEKKDKSKVLKMSRDYSHATLLLPEENLAVNSQKWRTIWDFPVKVSNSAVYLGKSDSNNSDVVQVKLTGVPVWMEREELLEWLSWFGQVVSNFKIKRIQEGDPLNNAGGLIDMTGLEVEMILNRHFREREIVETSTIHVKYSNQPKTCYNCKKSRK